MAIVNEDDLEWTQLSDGEMNVRRKQLAEATDSEQLGCSLYELESGDESWPYHYHTANEEALYVLTGSGTIQLADEMHSLTSGDYVALSADETGGHKVINDSEGTLRYLLFSTMNEPDVTVYPELDKIGVFVGSPPGGREERSHQGFYRIDDDVDYWE